MIKLGTNNIKNIKLGLQQIKSVFLGNNKVWSFGSWVRHTDQLFSFNQTKGFDLNFYPTTKIRNIIVIGTMRCQYTDYYQAELSIDIYYEDGSIQTIGGFSTGNPGAWYQVNVNETITNNKVITRVSALGWGRGTSAEVSVSCNSYEQFDQ